jgi:hypothetical protein
VQKADDAGIQVDNDAGVDDGGPETTDAGQGDAGEQASQDAGCIFPAESAIPFSPDGTEDYVRPAPFGSVPETNLLATWSHVDGDNFVVEMRFGAPPLRIPHDFSYYVGFYQDVDAGPSSLFTLCAVRPLNGDPSGCTNPTSLGVGDEFQPDAALFTWPPQDFGVADAALYPFVEHRDPCAGIFETPHDPLLRMLFALSVVSDGVRAPRYVIQLMGEGDCGPDSPFGVSGCYVTWTNATDTITSRGNLAPTTETFESVCDIACPNEQ